MKTQLDPRIEEIRVKYKLQREDFWELPQKKDTWLVSHKALEVVAVEAGITFDMPEIVEARSADKTAVMVVRGFMGDRSEWSMGEACPANNKNAYPFSMAEKRGKDRVILKLAGIHGLLYSEDEFKDPPPSDEDKAGSEAYVPAKGGGYKDAKGFTDGQMNSAGKRAAIEDLTADMLDVTSNVLLDKLWWAWKPILDKWQSDGNDIEMSWKTLAMDLFTAKRKELNQQHPIEAG